MPAGVRFVQPHLNLFSASVVVVRSRPWCTGLDSNVLSVSDNTLRCAGEVYAVKDTAEVTCIKKAAFLAANAFTKFTVPQIESASALMMIAVTFA